MGWLLPPTDNLHKFCAVSGLALIAFPVAAFTYLVDYTEELTDIAELGIAKVEVDSRHVNDITHLSQLYLKIMDAQLDKRVKREDLKAFPSLETLDKRIEERREQMRAIGIRNAENRLAHAKALRFKGYGEVAYYPLLLLVFIGGQLVVFGFRGWAKLSEQEKARSRTG